MSDADAPEASRLETGYVCEQCREPIKEEASVCPHCRYDPADDYGGAGWRTIVGGLLIVTIIGAPVGLLLIHSANKRRKRANEASPAVPV